MEQILELICTYVSIWCPSLVATLGVVATVLFALAEVRKAINNFKADDTMKELKDALKQSVDTNKELTKQNKILTDKLAKIKDYSDTILKGE